MVVRGVRKGERPARRAACRPALAVPFAVLMIWLSARAVRRGVAPADEALTDVVGVAA